MITIKYIDPISKLEIYEEINELETNLIEYTVNLHKNKLCKNFCDGENCKIWIKVNQKFILAGIQD